MNNRIRDLRKTLKMSQKEFAEKIGLKQNAISYMEKSAANITDANIRYICARFYVNENWLRAGAGNMFMDTKDFSEFYKVYKQLEPSMQEYLINTAQELLNAQEKLKDKQQ